MNKKTSIAIAGLGLMAQFHIPEILKQKDTTEVVVVCEPSRPVYEESRKLFLDAGVKPPPNEPDFNRMLSQYAENLEVVFIITPHVYHFDQAKASLETGLDVLLEKPMVMTPEEAQLLIDVTRKSGKLLVIAFQGSLSPQIRTAVKLLQSGALGKLQSISATVWQDWGEKTAGTWRQDPEMSGGGFLFDTGAHMLNTVADLAGEEFTEVSAWFRNNGRRVETQAAIIARLASEALVTLHATGDTIPSCNSEIFAYYSKAIIRSGIWGECLEIQYSGEESFSSVEFPDSQGVWEQFLAIRKGEMENSSPPEKGLRMACLYQAIKESALSGGIVVPVKKS